LIGKGGETFDKPEEIPVLLERVKENYSKYQESIEVSSIGEIGKKYYDFLTQVYKMTKFDSRKIKLFRIKKYLTVRIGIYYWKINGRILRIFEK